MSLLQEKFFDLLRFSLGITDSLEAPIEASEWDALLELANDQSLVGILYSGIERLPQELRPQQRQQRFTWMATKQQIEQYSQQVTRQTVNVINRLRSSGFDACVLKGQGVARLYPQPLLRTAGDIDVWVLKDQQEAVDETIDFVRSKMGSSADEAVYHHIGAGEVQGIDVELHYRPTFLCSPSHNRQLQRFFRQQASTQLSHQITLDGKSAVPVPTASFNRIFLLAHISRHLLQDGIGLRQLVDYYYVLQQGFTPSEQAADQRVLHQCGLSTLAGAVMYVMQQLFRLSSDQLIVPADEPRGRFLLHEIMLGGNFGQHDKRVSTFARENRLGRNLQRLRRDLRLLRYFPSECIWEPLFRIWHLGWRYRHRPRS